KVNLDIYRLFLKCCLEQTGGPQKCPSAHERRVPPSARNVMDRACGTSWTLSATRRVPGRRSRWRGGSRIARLTVLCVARPASWHKPPSAPRQRQDPSPQIQVQGARVTQVLVFFSQSTMFAIR